ncbi:DUF2218 domain-containing protein [Tardiphaga sp.]|jgi:hypothetical protein|uniref:DUF2218 domain-containing protein n=1 Tax=Tardiphaga sp. TaxID=1926292 RepID=UPI0037DA1F27
METPQAHTTRAVIKTAHGSRYLQQLCKHWSHKFETTFDLYEGRVILTIGDVNLSARPDHLVVQLNARTAQDLQTLREVLISHVDRFAFRETLLYDWDL